MFLTAPLVHNGYRFLPERSVIETDDRGTITAVHEGLDSEDILHYEGILCPGFVNAHCHLELSHLKGALPEHTGLIPFLKQIPETRIKFTDDQIRIARHEAYDELVRNGVVAVGDIANLTDTLDVRALDKLHFHSFAECIGFTETYARQSFQTSLSVYESFAGQQQKRKMLRQSVVPHAPYSVSSSLFRMIDQHSPATLISIHNQESESENEYYQAKTGAVKSLLSGFSIDDHFFLPSGKTSIQTYATWLSPRHSFIFVHNTFTTEEDINFINERFDKSFWCFCPNANLYIENSLPDVDIFLRNNATICIGTDSLASNHQLCVLAELQTLKRHYPSLTWEALLQWSTLNGACALNMEETIGSIEPGKQPGILNLAGIDTDNPILRRII